MDNNIQAREELRSINANHEFDRVPLYVTDGVVDLIEEEPNFASHRREMIVNKMAVVRGYDLTKDHLVTDHILILPYPNYVNRVWLSFGGVMLDGQPAYMVKLAAEPMPQDMERAFHG